MAWWEICCRCMRIHVGQKPSCDNEILPCWIVLILCLVYLTGSAPSSAHSSLPLPSWNFSSSSTSKRYVSLSFLEEVSGWSSCLLLWRPLGYCVFGDFSKLRPHCTEIYLTCTLNSAPLYKFTWGQWGHENGRSTHMNSWTTWHKCTQNEILRLVLSTILHCQLHLSVQSFRLPALMSCATA